MTDVIDLRNKRNGEARRVTIKEVPENEEEFQESTLASLSADEDESEISWAAYEYEKRAYGKYWYIKMGVIVSVLIVFSVLAKSYFFLAFVILAFTMLVVYSRREPRKISFTISAGGIFIGNRLQEFSNFKSFWIFNKQGIRELLLETGQMMQPYLHLPLGDADIKKIRKILISRLPEKEYQEPMLDQLARALGF
jgi:hypothetical protein